MIFKLKKENYAMYPVHFPSLILSLVLLGLSFYTEKSIVLVDNPNLYMYFISKSLFFMFVYLIINFLVTFISNLIIGDFFYKTWFKYFVVLFSFYLFLLLMTWPGIIIWDEFWVYHVTTQFKLDDWQSYITQFYYLINFYLFPSFGMIVLFQITMFAFVSSWFITNTLLRYSHKYTKVFSVLLMIVLMITPTVMFSMLNTFRSTPLAILELWLLGILLFGGESFKRNKMLFIWLFLCTVFLSVWRKEGVYHVVLVPIALYFSSYNLKIKAIVKFFLCCLVGVVILTLGSSIVNSENTSLRYKLTTYINPLSVILADKNVNTNGIDISKIDKVIDVEKMKSQSFYYEIPSYWDGAVRDNITKSDVELLEKEYIKLILQNPDVFLTTRARTMLAASGLSSFSRKPIDFYQNYKSGENIPDYILSTFNNKYNHPVFENIRGMIVSIMNWSTETNGYIYNLSIIWNFIPLLIFVLLLLVRARRGNSPLWWGTLLVTFRIPIIFLTEPGSYFMYYFPFYLTAIFILYIWITDYFSSKVNLCAK